MKIQRKMLNRKSLFNMVIYFFLNYGVIRKINTEFSGISDKTVLKMLKFYIVLNLRKDERFYLYASICHSSPQVINSVSDTGLLKCCVYCHVSSCVCVCGSSPV